MAAQGWQYLGVSLFSGSQAASFLDVGLPGDPVDLGDGAAWSDIGSRLPVRRGDRVLGIAPATGVGTADARMSALAIAKLVLPRLGG